ncbi:hypothetical protein [Acetobacterium wieringae]|uniref:hypothetical protein n=1 Tax=Acetobacterium wieringae TaxID=52694 RepID=UPI00203483BB|nr:hypothetical protein [Acetobacterium wieringae]URN83110.1 hypothetical protein CHL1_002227 [Acetobacterium wieringae]
MTTISGSPVFCSRWDSLGNFEVIDIPEGQPIILSGAFKDVLVQAPDINLELAPGTTVMRLIAGIDDTQKSTSGLVVSGDSFIDRFEVDEFSDNVSVGQNVSILHAIIEGDNARFNGNVTGANITGDNAGFRNPPLGYTGNPPVIINPPAPPAMQADAGAAKGAGKFFVVSAAGADSTKTKLTFTYGTDFGGILEYAIVADGAASSTGSWADVPATGVQTGDLAATATGDLYVRIKAVPGASNASAEVKALNVLALGLTTPGSSSAELIISGQSSTTLDYVVVMDDLGSIGETGELNDPILLEVSINTPQVTGVPFNPITDNANIYVYLNDGTQITNQDFSSFYPGNTFNFNALNNYLWVKVISENLSTTKYYKIFVQF